MRSLIQKELVRHEHAFELYASMKLSGRGGSYREVARRMGVHCGSVKLWAKSFGWQRRLRLRGWGIGDGVGPNEDQSYLRGFNDGFLAASNLPGDPQVRKCLVCGEWFLANKRSRFCGGDCTRAYSSTRSVRMGNTHDLRHVDAAIALLNSRITRRGKKHDYQGVTNG